MPTVNTGTGADGVTDACTDDVLPVGDPALEFVDRGVDCLGQGFRQPQKLAAGGVELPYSHELVEGRKKCF